MDELQYGLIPNTDPSNVAIPVNNTGVRLFKNTDDGKYYIKLSDDSIQLFSASTGGTTSLFEEITDVGNALLAETDLYVNQIAGNVLGNIGDAVKANYAIILADTENAKVVRLYFAGQKIFESVIDYSTGQLFNLDFNAFLIRIDADTVKTIVSYFANGVTESQINEITGIDFTASNDLRLTGEGVANNDIVAKFNKGVLVPKS